MMKSKQARPAQGLAVAMCAAALLAGCNDFWHDLAYVPAKTPLINGQPQDAAVTVGGSATLTVSVTVSDGGALSYQWYGSLDSSNSGGSLISGNGNTARYTPPTDTAGTFYYYVVVTNSKNGTSATVTSTAVKISVYAVSGVSVTPLSPSVKAGGTQVFSATVNGDNGTPPQDVTWSISTDNATWGAATAGGSTFNSETRTLAVNANETAGAIYVRAVSTADGSKYGTATVTIPRAGMGGTVDDWANGGSGTGVNAD